MASSNQHRQEATLRSFLVPVGLRLVEGETQYLDIPVVIHKNIFSSSTRAMDFSSMNKPEEEMSDGIRALVSDNFKETLDKL